MNFVKEWMTEAVNNSLQGIVIKLDSIETKLKNTETNNNEKKWNIISTIANVITTITAIIAVALSYNAWQSSNETLKEQRNTQAYTYWQGYLQLAVEQPAMANGLDTIKGFSIAVLAAMCPDEYKKDKQKDSAHAEYVKYAWFVSNTLNAAEIVYNLQPDDKPWRRTLIHVIKSHKSFLNTPKHEPDDYESSFNRLINEAIK